MRIQDRQVDKGHKGHRVRVRVRVNRGQGGDRRGHMRIHTEMTGYNYN